MCESVKYPPWHLHMDVFGEIKTGKDNWPPVLDTCKTRLYCLLIHISVTTLTETCMSGFVLPT
jgi:hypothetical protein